MDTPNAGYTFFFFFLMGHAGYTSKPIYFGLRTLIVLYSTIVHTFHVCVHIYIYIYTHTHIQVSTMDGGTRHENISELIDCVVVKSN